MKRKPINWKRRWAMDHRRAFKVSKDWWRKQMPPQGWGVKQVVACYDDTGRIIVVGGSAGMTPPDDERRPGLRQKLMNLLTRLWWPLNAQERAMIAAYRQCGEDTKKALLHLANESSKVVSVRRQ